MRWNNRFSIAKFGSITSLCSLEKFVHFIGIMAPFPEKIFKNKKPQTKPTCLGQADSIRGLKFSKNENLATWEYSEYSGGGGKYYHFHFLILYWL